MSHTILVDQARAIAALVNDDPMYALGPAIAADEPEEAAEALEAFVAALDAPPEQMPTIQLMTEWSSFILALHGMISAPPESGVEAPVAPSEAPADHQAAGAVLEAQEAPQAPEPWSAEHATAAEDPAAGEAIALAGAEPADLDLEAEPERDVTPDELHNRLHQIPGGTPAQRGEADCWACGGDGHMNIAGELVDCNVCNGSGRVTTGTPA